MAGEKETERRRLSIAELRKMKNYENVSEEQAQEIIFAVRNLAVMFYEHLNKKQKEQELTKEEKREGKDTKAEKSKADKLSKKDSKKNKAAKTTIKERSKDDTRGKNNSITIW
ncbi:MAG: hypothetical protein JSU07_10415 [Bacteroidetes bacterium]|nr:hypothetical protein [Bacteroidota bacterium]